LVRCTDFLLVEVVATSPRGAAHGIALDLRIGIEAMEERERVCEEDGFRDRN